MRIRRAVVLLLAAGLLPGCYTRQPLQSGAPAPRDRIVAVVNDTGTVLLGNDLGPGVVEIEGVVSTATAEQWTVHMLRVEHRDGRQVSWNRELVTIPRSALSSPQVVILDRTRSWLAAGGVIVGAVALARVFGLSFGSDEDSRGPGGPPPVELIGGSRR
jgi:hypothetical protein